MLLDKRPESLRSQRIELALSDCPVVNQALQDFGAEPLTIVDNKIEGAALLRCTTLQVEIVVGEREPGGNFDRGPKRPGDRRVYVWYLLVLLAIV